MERGILLMRNTFGINVLRSTAGLLLLIVAGCNTIKDGWNYSPYNSESSKKYQERYGDKYDYMKKSDSRSAPFFTPVDMGGRE
jgi:hypothetical protein